MVVFTDLNKKRTRPNEQAFASGKSPYKGSLGPNKTPEDNLRDQWLAEMRDNPDYKNFYTGARTFAEVAPLSQQKIDASMNKWYADFENPGDNAFAQNFLEAYSEGFTTKNANNTAESKGLLGTKMSDDGVTNLNVVSPANLSQVATADAASANAVNDSNVAGKFPSQGVAI